MSKYLRVMMLISLMLLTAVSVQAAVYGYVNMTGKNEERLKRELNTLEKLINTWKNGKVLYVHKVERNYILTKNFAYTVIFSGDRANISKFLTSGNYEGDFLKDIIVHFRFTSDAYCYCGNPGPDIAPYTTTFERKYSNPAQALEVIKNKDLTGLWLDFSKTRKRDYEKHLIDGKLVKPSADIVFYSLMFTEGNRLFGTSYTEKKIKPYRAE
ncbi:MAG: hypothetical protein GX221_10780 [Candidatus Riflebacteria bacterium]|nr:hypothetical protein [Candidatus Riflebacteria bacterium]